jgi:hypothetical protein
MPPAPIRLTISYGPKQEPVASDISISNRQSTRPRDARLAHAARPQ